MNEPSQNEEPKALLRTSGWSLRLSLLLYVTLALFPIAVASMLQGIDRARHDVEDVRETLSATAREAATPEQNVLAAAGQIVRALSNLPDVREATPRCDQELAESLRGLAFFKNIAREDANGRIVCSADPSGIGVDASKRPIWKNIASRTEFVVNGDTISPRTHTPLIQGLLPLRDAKGRFIGALGITVDAGWLNYMVSASRLPSDSIVAITDQSGHVIAANDAAVASSIFVHANVAAHGDLHSAKDFQGQTWTFTTAPLLGSHVFVGFAMRESSLFRPTYIHVFADFILPFLMIALTWLAIWIVTDRQLTRWIIYLRRIAAAYRTGHYSVRPVLDDAPSEFRILGDALADMAAAIQDRDRSLREAVTQKTVLIKEIHHRVKNNLQVVMSLLSLQAAQLSDPAAQLALRQTRARINALALVHRILYEIDDQSSVNMKTLLEQLSEQTNEGFGGDRRDLRILVDAIPRTVSGDTAVPLALFAVEALTNAFKHAYPPGRGGQIRVRLTSVEGGKLRLSVEDDGVGFQYEDVNASVGARLIKTFGQQVSGEASISSDKGHGTIVEIVFPDPAQTSK
jgi:two-component sensor histidine kinase